MQLYPLTFEPILKERVWGGRNLERLYRKLLAPASPVGESWELSDRPGDVSVVANGALKGQDLHTLVQEFGRDLTGRARLYNGRFPLLIKILDAQEKLSLQVHPPAKKAVELGGEPKTELWYVAEAGPDAELYVGLKRGCTREEFARRLASGTVEACFHRVRVRAGDAMFLPSGRVHALGAGLVIFEIQQNSDTTYRVFDWNRVGLDGKPRQLHLEESLASINFEDFEPALVRPPDKSARAVLVRDPLFTVELAHLEPDEAWPFESGTMRILGLVSGAVEVQSAGSAVGLKAGQFCLVPAGAPAPLVRAEGVATLLHVQAGEEGAG